MLFERARRYCAIPNHASSQPSFLHRVSMSSCVLFLHNRTDLLKPPEYPRLYRFATWSVPPESILVPILHIKLISAELFSRMSTSSLHFPLTLMKEGQEHVEQS